MTSENGSNTEIILLTGWRGVGKTTLLQRLIAAAQQAGWSVGGLLSPARVEAGEKTGIEVVDVRSGARRLLASRRAGELSGAALGPWAFDDGAIAWGDGVLKRMSPCDLFVLDELGPLEFEQRKGWTAGLDFLARGDGYRLAIVIVRPECVETFLQRRPDASMVSVGGTAEVERLAQEIAGRYWYEVEWKAK